MRVLNRYKTDDHHFWASLLLEAGLYFYDSWRVHQVWSILMEFLSDLSDKEREKLLVLAYDDMCHLKVRSCRNCKHHPRYMGYELCHFKLNHV